MLPAASRLRRSREYSEVIGAGVRAGSPRLVVHLDPAPVASSTSEPKAGFVVSKAVGGSVVRHAVVRRLRHLVLARLSQLPPGTRLVVRALPAAAGASSAQLGADLDTALTTALRRRSQRPPSRTMVVT